MATCFLVTGAPPPKPRKCEQCKFFSGHTKKCAIFYKPAEEMRVPGGPCGVKGVYFVPYKHNSSEK